MTIKSESREKEFIVQKGSPLTIIPPKKEIIKDKKILPITGKHQDCNKNEVKFAGKITVEAENREIRKNLPMFVIEQGRQKAITRHGSATRIQLDDTKLQKYNDFNQPVGNGQNISKF